MHVKTTLALVALVAVHAPAQGARGAGPDATTIPAGSFRVSAAATWKRHVESYFDGALKELGARYSLDSLGASAFPSLASTEAASRSASGLSGFRATLGALKTHARTSFESTPFSVEYGVTSKFSVGVTIPLVTHTARVDAVMNPLGTEASVGLNPAYSTPSLGTANGALIGQIEGAATTLNGRIASCAANPAGAGCGPVNANPSGARALVDESVAYATALAMLYGGKSGVASSRFIPVAGSTAQVAVATRLADFKTRYGTFGSANAITGSAPAGGAPITTAEFQSILTDSAYGVLSKPLGSVVRRGIGDIEMGAQFTFFDSHASTESNQFWWRGAVGGTWRLATGAKADDAREPIALALGSGETDFEGRVIIDAGKGRRWSMSGAASYALHGGDDLSPRGSITTSDLFNLAARAAAAEHPAGSVIRVELAPRLSPTEAMSIAATYAFRSKSEESEESEQRLGASLAYSTIAAYHRGDARWPLEFSIAHYQTVSGSGGSVPKLSYDAVTVRWYRLRKPQPATPARARD